MASKSAIPALKLFQVYKISNSYDDLIYVGCTRQGISTRFHQHFLKSFCDTSRDYNAKLQTHIRLLGFGHFSISVLDERMCDISKLEHTKFEQEYIDRYNSELNSNRAFATRHNYLENARQWKRKHKNKRQEEHRIYRQNNKEKEKRRHAKYQAELHTIQCCCGGSYKTNKTRHELRKIHLNYIQSIS